MDIIKLLLIIILYLIIIILLVFGIVMLILLITHKIRIIPNITDTSIIHPAVL